MSERRSRHGRSRSRSRSRSPVGRRGDRQRSRSRSPPRRTERTTTPPHSPPAHLRQQHRERERGGRLPQKKNTDELAGLSEALRNLPESERFGQRSSEQASGEGGEPSTAPQVPKIEPNYGLSGKLAAETNSINGIQLKYSEPQDAMKPKKRWRLHVFKGTEQLEPLRIYRQSAYLLGRERSVVDIPTDHPSCSKQHAAIQFRQVEVTKPDGKLVMTVKPYLIDLESANGTFINGDRIDSRRYIELKEKDAIKFGSSTREYILLIEPGSD